MTDAPLSRMEDGAVETVWQWCRGKNAQSRLAPTTASWVAVVGVMCMIRNRMLCQCQHFDDAANIGVYEFEH